MTIWPCYESPGQKRGIYYVTVQEVVGHQCLKANETAGVQTRDSKILRKPNIQSHESKLNKLSLLTPDKTNCRGNRIFLI